MTVYALAQFRIHDPALYGRYVARFPEVLARHGGRVVIADPAPRVVEGAWDGDKVVLLAFDDPAAFEGWASSEAYRTLAKDRLASTDGCVIVCRGFEAPRAAPRYDAIGVGYAKRRVEDPRLRARILDALGDAQVVVNVGAGAGSYEPTDRRVIAIEPSDVMAQQRRPELTPAICATAEALPLRDRSADAAMAILTIHHWDAARERGVRELRRVARGPVVIVTFDPDVSSAMWLMAEYLPEVAALDRQIFPSLDTLARWLGGRVRVDTVPIPYDTPDWMLGSFWAHPERVLDPEARAATSGFARMPPAVVERVVGQLQRDLEDGTWDRRHADLRRLEEYDAGLRLIVATP